MMMTFRLDHVIIAVHDLDTAMADYRALGFTVFYGGRHASGTTHNALVCFQDGCYLELLALTGDPRSDDHAADFSGLVQSGEGLAGYALLVDDLEAAIPGLQERGVQVGAVVPGQRNRTDGVVMRWLTASIAGGMSPFLIEDETPRNLRVPDTPDKTQHANGVVGITGLDVLVPALDSATINGYTALLGVSPWRSTAQMTIFLLLGAKLRLIPAVTPDLQAYLARGKTPLHSLTLLGNTPRQVDPAAACGVSLRIEAALA
ncbi:MAG: VOC family protein [Anaerolineaceae bacterium]|nr:VOC family protein [Anaerolineaceae bacterium]